MSLNFYLLDLVKLDFNGLEQFLSDNLYKDSVSLKWTCCICGFTCQAKQTVARHIEAKHVSLPELLCPTCGKPSKTRHSLRVHMKAIHDQIYQN